MKSDVKIDLMRRFNRVSLIVLGFLILLFFNTPKTQAELLSSTLAIEKPVVEHLRLHVLEENKEAWLEAEKGSWAKWLPKQKGFLDRQLFWDPDREEATLLIRWSSRKNWKAIANEEINAVQIQFEQLARDETGIESGNPFPIVFEGELHPQ